jgi:hypothetical protein
MAAMPNRQFLQRGRCGTIGSIKNGEEQAMSSLHSTDHRQAPSLVKPASLRPELAAFFVLAPRRQPAFERWVPEHGILAELRARRECD